MEKLKYFVAVAGGVLFTYFKMYAPLFIVVVLVMAFDFFTGIVAANLTGEGWNSNTAREGAMKKGMLIAALFFGILLDFILPMAAQQVGFAFDVHLLFSSIIGFYIIFTECVSVCENFYECCPNSFPKWIVKFLTAGKDQLDQLGETITEEDEQK